MPQRKSKMNWWSSKALLLRALRTQVSSQVPNLPPSKFSITMLQMQSALKAVRCQILELKTKDQEVALAKVTLILQGLFHPEISSYKVSQKTLWEARKVIKVVIPRTGLAQRSSRSIIITICHSSQSRPKIQESKTRWYLVQVLHSIIKHFTHPFLAWDMADHHKFPLQEMYAKLISKVILIIFCV